MRKFYFLLLCLSLAGTCFAQLVSQQEASVAAQRFLASQGKTLVRCAKTVESDCGTLLYIFNAKDAFVVVAGDRNAQPVLAYVNHEPYQEEVSVPPFEMWMNHYANQIEQIRKTHTVQPEFAEYWQRILSGAPAFRNGDHLDSLLFSKWDQGDYYNYYCPRDLSGPNGRVVTGCVATAMAQLIYYYRFPESGTGSYSYTDEHYGVQSADYGNAVYNYNAMCDKPTAINPEISELIYHCGVGVDMHYGPDGSGMTNHSAARVLRTYFKFSPETEYLFRDSTDLNWDSVIVSHLSRRIPMYYAGWSVPNINGHGFICDGYKTVDSSYYFHFNFGWSGSRDGFYYTNALNVGGYNFNLAQELIVNAYPDTAQYTYPTPYPLTGSMMLTADEGTFTDGSPADIHCAPGMDFTWQIEPNSVNLSGIKLDIDYSIADGDTLFIGTCNDMTVPTSITADTGTLHLDVSCPDLVIRIVTATSSASEGFRASYAAQRLEYCSGTKMFTSATGHITDGSEGHDYNNFSDCRFRIIVNSFSAVIFHVNSLDLEEGKDFLHVYQGTVNPSSLVLSMTGHITDTSFVVNDKRITLVLETDETGTDAGFDIDYEASHVGIEQHAAKTLTVYPNPAKDMVTIAGPEPLESVEILNTDGRKVFSIIPHAETVTVPVQHLPSGIYLINTRTATQVTTTKFVKL